LPGDDVLHDERDEPRRSGFGDDEALNDGIAYGLWLLVSLDSFVLIAIAVRFASDRPHAIDIRAVR
jgi:hypothetical protein